MIRILLYLSPAIIPLLLYVISFVYINRKAIKYGHEKPKFFSYELFKAFMHSLFIAIICFLIFIFIYFLTINNGEYIPARIENGEMVRGYKK